MGFDLLGFLTGIKTKVYLWALGALGIVIAVVKIYLKGRSEGARDLSDNLRKKTDKVQDEWTKIDRRPDDFDSAIDGLRSRAPKTDYNPKP